MPLSSQSSCVVFTCPESHVASLLGSAMASECLATTLRVPRGSGLGQPTFLGDSPMRVSDAMSPHRASCRLPAFAGSHAGCTALLSKVIIDLVPRHQAGVTRHFPALREFNPQKCFSRPLATLSPIQPQKCFSRQPQSACDVHLATMATIQHRKVLFLPLLTTLA